MISNTLIHPPLGVISVCPWTCEKVQDGKLKKDVYSNEYFYLTASRPDIMLSAYLCVHFQASPKESYLHAVKWVIRYVKGTSDFGLCYPKYASFDLLGYGDADFVRSKIDRNSISGTCQFLGHSLLSWFSKKQNCVALSTTETEFIAVGLCCAQILWMRQTLQDCAV